MKITKVIGREIFDSRGFPTIECQLVLDDQFVVTASVPSGASTGKYEALEMRDGGPRLFGKGVTKAIEILEKTIAPALLFQGPDVLEIDQKLLELDGTPQKEKLGANTMLAASIAVLKAQTMVERMELFELIARLYGGETVTLPFPMINCINGGAHADNGLRIQEYMIMPIEGSNFRQAMDSSVTVYQTLKEILKKSGKITAVGDEGGFACRFENDIEPLDFLMQALEQANAVGQFRLALDVAASQFYDQNKKVYHWNNKEFTSQDLIELYVNLTEKYPIISIEDGLAEDDWESWIELQQVLGQSIQVVGDDVFVTNPHRILHGIKSQAANAVIIKPNQIGTVTQTLQAIKLCQENGFSTIISHRSGETEDTFIADLAVGTSAGQVKFGGCSRTERMMKYNRLLRIEDQLITSLLD